MDWRTWVPFQSKKVREIYEHMTADERREIAQRAYRWGRTVGWLFAAPFAFVFTFGVWPKLAPKIGFAYGSGAQIPLWLAISIIVILVAICLPAAIRFRKKQRELLASTEWARAQGYTADGL